MVRVAIQAGETDGRYRVDGAARTVELLMFLSSAGRPRTLRDLVEGLGWSKPTVYRLLRTLETCGALRHIEGKGYVLGPSMITIGQAALRAVELIGVARPHLEHLHDELGETVNLTVLDGADIVYIDRVEDKQILGVRLNVGSRLPAYCTSMGQVLLAGLSDDDIARRLTTCSFARCGPNTLRSFPALRRRLEEVRAQGYAINDEELAIGHRAAGAPVRDHEGDAVAAINVSVPAVRVSHEHLENRIVPVLVQTAEAISHQLGGAAEPIV